MLQDIVMVIYTVSYPPRLIPVSLVLPSLDDLPANAPSTAPGAAPQAAPPAGSVKVSATFSGAPFKSFCCARAALLQAHAEYEGVHDRSPT